MEEFRTNKSVMRLREYGTAGMTITANTMNFFPTRYWSQGYFERWEEIGPDAIKSVLKRPSPCWMCPIACGRLVEIDTKWGKIEMDGPEYETIYALGGLIGISDLRELVYLNYLADDLGMDTISLGNVIGFAIEASKRGKIKMSLDYGDIEGIVGLVNDIAFRRNYGNLLAEGVAEVARELKLEDLAVHVKKLEPAGYDPRRLKGMILGYATSPRGACHLRMMAYYVDIRGLGGDPQEVSMRKIQKLVEFGDFMTAYDSMILCKFGRSIYTLDLIWKLYNTFTGADMDLSDFKNSLANIRTLVQYINLKANTIIKMDILPKRFLEESIRDQNGNVYKITKEEVEFMISRYYELRGFDKEGRPKSRLSDIIDVKS